MGLPGPPLVPATAPDNDRVAPDDACDPTRSTDTGGSPANDATDTPTAHTPHCNTATADAPAQTPAHNPSASNNEPENYAPALAEPESNPEMTRALGTDLPRRSSLGAKRKFGSEATLRMEETAYATTCFQTITSPGSPLVAESHDSTANGPGPPRDPPSANWTGPSRENGPGLKRY